MASTCGRCGVDNRQGRRFCAECGAPLAIACAACGFANEPGEKFCGGCGAPLGAGAAHAGELRQVVVMFADLAGYTRLSGTLAPEDVHALLGRFFAAVDGTVAAHGGTIDKHIGDNVMALFGAPIAHGNDAELAVRSAFEIHREVEALGAELALPLRLSVGIAAGQVMASGLGSAHHREYTVIGSSVNLAARLQGFADAGDTVVDDTVHRAVADLVDAECVDGLELKGIDAPVRAWRLRALRPAAEAAHRPLLGRVAELGQLRAALELCARRQRGAVVALRGEPGIGKSRLAREATRVARELGVDCATAAFFDFGGDGRDLDGVIARAVDPAWLASARAADPLLHAALCDVIGQPVPASFARQYEALADAERTAAKRDGIASALADAARRRPLLVVIEDVHWCRPAQLPVVGGVAIAATMSPLVALITTRPEWPALDSDAWRAAAPGAALDVIDLAPLSEREAGELVAALGAQGMLGAAAVERAGGNPLFLEQLAAAAAEHGAQHDGLPGTVHSLVLARADRLPARDRAAVQVAAVLGLRFALAPLRELLGDADYDPGELVRRRLLSGTDRELAFRHALIRDGVYASLPRDRRRGLHLRAAALFPDDPLQRAEHLEQAGDPGAAACYRAAAQREAAALRLELALELLDKACALAPAGERHACELARGELLLAVGRARDAATAFADAGAHARADDERCRAAVAEASALRALSELDAAMAAVDRAERLGPGLRERVQIHCHRAALHFARCRSADSKREAEQATALADELDDPQWRARALSAVGDALWCEGAYATALSCFRRAVDLFDAAGLARAVQPNRVMQAHCLLWLGQLADAEELLDHAIAAAGEIRDRFAEMFARHSRALVRAARGDLAGAHDDVALSLSLARELGSVRFEYEILTQLAELTAAGDGSGLPIVRAAAELARARDVQEYCGPWTLGLLAALTDDPGERSAALAAGERLLRDGASYNCRLFFCRYASDAAARAGDLALADRYAAQWRQLRDASGSVAGSAEVSTVPNALSAPLRAVTTSGAG